MAPAMLDRTVLSQMGRSIAPIEYTAQQFEDFDITQYAQDILNRNSQLGQGELDSLDVALHWTMEVRRVYVRDEDTCDRLLAQVYCPLYDEYWTKRLDPSAILNLEAKDLQMQGFRPLRPANYDGKNLKPGDIVMERRDDGLKLLVPGVMLVKLSKISYTELARIVLTANPKEEVPRLVMQRLWVKIVHRVFHFESEAEKDRKTNETNDLKPDQYRDLIEEVSKHRTAQRPSKRKAVHNSSNEDDGSTDTGDESKAPRRKDKKPRSHRPLRDHSLHPKKKGTNASETTNAPIPPARQSLSPIDTPAPPSAARIPTAAVPSEALARELQTQPDSRKPADDDGEESAPDQQSQVSRPTVGGLRMMQTKRSSERLRRLGDRREEK